MTVLARARLALVFRFYKEGGISADRAAELAGLLTPEFLRRLPEFDPDQTFGAHEWAANPQPLEVPPAAAETIHSLVENPTEPNDALRLAAAKYKKSLLRIVR